MNKQSVLVVDLSMIRSINSDKKHIDNDGNLAWIVLGNEVMSHTAIATAITHTIDAISENSPNTLV